VILAAGLACRWSLEGTMSMEGHRAKPSHSQRKNKERRTKDSLRHNRRAILMKKRK
jgi:hypothetical protein